MILSSDVDPLSSLACDRAERWAASANGVEIDRSSGGNRNDTPDPHSMIAPPSGCEDGKSG